MKSNKEIIVRVGQKWQFEASKPIITVSSIRDQVAYYKSGSTELYFGKLNNENKPVVEWLGWYLIEDSHNELLNQE